VPLTILHKPLRPSLLLMAMSVVVPGALWLAVTINNRQDVCNAAAAELLNDARILSADTDRMIDTDQIVLDRVEEHLDGLTWEQVGEMPGLADYLASVSKRAVAVDSLIVLGPDGRIRAASFPLADRSDGFGDREFFTEVPPHPGVFVSRLFPDLGVGDGRWGFTVSRRVLDAKGVPGVILVGVAVDRFFDFCKELVANPDDVCTIAREDGVVIARFPVDPGGMKPLPGAARLAQASRAAPEGFLDVKSQIDGIERLIAFKRVAEPPLTVALGRSVARIDALWEANLVRFALIAVPAALALMLVSFLVVRQVARERATIARLAEAQEQLRQVQKMESLGQLTGGVAHDFNNLLTVIQGNVTLLRRNLRDPERQMRLLDAVERAADRAAALTRHLLAFARKQPLRPMPIDLNGLLRDLIELLLRSLPPNIRITTDLEGGLRPVLVDAAQLETAVLNIAVNARDAMPEGGTLGFATHADAEGQMVELAIADTGIGMDADTAARAFEPFFTTKEVGRGTGLGLSMVYGFVRQSGGRITIDSRPGRGTTLRIALPSTEPVQPSRPKPAAIRAVGGRILLVEDEAEVAHATAEMLRDAGFEVDHTPDAAMALEQIDAGYDLILCDIFLPGADSGLALALKLRKMDPDLAILLTTGSGQAAIEARAAGFPVVSKPFSIAALLDAIGKAVAAERA
jgi:signal transduction histidine kinase